MTTQVLLLIAGVGVAVGMLAGAFAARLWLAATVLGCSASLLAAIHVLTGGGAFDWPAAFELGGEPLHLALDALGALFLAPISLLCGVGALYASGYWTERAHPRSARSGRVWWSLLAGSLMLVLLARNGLHFLIGWELFTLAAYFLVTLERQQSEVRAAGWLYLGASHVAVLFLFAFFAALAARSGSWELGPLRAQAALAPLFWLALVGFGLKAGLFPLHVWLPSAHANAPSHVSALLSGATIKLGIYGLARFSSWLPVPPAAGWVIVALGMASALLGVAFALGQHDFKRLLAYHSVENIGIILIGLGFAIVAADAGGAAWGRLALAGALLHVWNHALFKALLFFGAGAVLHATGTREMSRLGGLWRAMPWTTALFAFAALAICGLPPLNGFVSEWLVYLGLFDAANARGAPAGGALSAAILLAATGALALACFVKVCGVVFLGAARSPAVARAHECGAAMRAAMLVLALACAAIGLAPAMVWPALASAIGDWRADWAGAELPAPLASLGYASTALALLAAAAAAVLWSRTRRMGSRRALTWDCGHAEPSARAQYSAGSFAAILVEWFAWILRPETHARPPLEIFARSASSTTHTPETVLERIVEPAGRAITRAALVAQRLQHGRVQAYVFYLVVGIAALAGVVLLASGS